MYPCRASSGAPGTPSGPRAARHHHGAWRPQSSGRDMDATTSALPQPHRAALCHGPLGQGGIISPTVRTTCPAHGSAPRQAKQRHSAPGQLGHTLMMKPPDGGPPHSSNGKQPTHQTQSILRRINIHTSIMTNEYRGMTCSQNDRTVDNAHDGASNHPPPIVSRKRTENKNKYLSIPYLDPCQVDNLIYLRSCNISFVPDKSF